MFRAVGRCEYTGITDDEALAAFRELSETEGIIPARVQPRDRSRDRTRRGGQPRDDSRQSLGSGRQGHGDGGGAVRSLSGDSSAASVSSALAGPTPSQVCPNAIPQVCRLVGIESIPRQRQRHVVVREARHEVDVGMVDGSNQRPASI